jgi:hypothetical protein
MYFYCENRERQGFSGVDCGAAIIDGEKVFPSITTVKEKFGILSVYTDTGDSRLLGMMQLAEFISRRTCEFCGTQRNVGKTIGRWIYTCCELCHEKNERAEDLTWAPND